MASKHCKDAFAKVHASLAALSHTTASCRVLHSGRAKTIAKEGHPGATRAPYSCLPLSAARLGGQQRRALGTSKATTPPCPTPKTAATGSAALLTPARTLQVPEPKLSPGRSPCSPAPVWAAAEGEPASKVAGPRPDHSSLKDACFYSCDISFFK